jgi:hypothetical protein
MRVWAKAAVVSVVCAAACLWVLFAWSGHVYKQRIAIQKKRFESNRAKYAELVREWRMLHPHLKACGTPAPAPGFVRIADFGLEPGPKFQLAGDDPDNKSWNRTVSSIREASAILGVEQSDSERLNKGMSDVSVTRIFQSGDQLSFVQDDDAVLAFAFVPNECSGRNDFQFWSSPGHQGPFAYLENVGSGWYFYQANR